eukprot:352159-Chlamydomonas_euryale.AAC.5
MEKQRKARWFGHAVALHQDGSASRPGRACRRARMLAHGGHTTDPAAAVARRSTARLRGMCQIAARHAIRPSDGSCATRRPVDESTGAQCN